MSKHGYRPCSSQWASPPRKFPATGFHLIDSSMEIEEETLPTYNPEKYYPVQQGEILNDRYQVVAKLGYGVTSTVWFGRDLLDSKYVALKVCVTGQEENRELNIYDRINSVQTTHPGTRFIRKLYSSFFIEGPHGRHLCLVHELLGENALEVVQMGPGRAMTIRNMKPCIRQLLVVLDFLHSESLQVIHTDLQLKNLLLPSPETNMLLKFENQEVKAPSARKVLEDRTIYTSSKNFPGGSGLPLLTDFGEARCGKEHHADIMPNMYRAPEVILKTSWDCKVDIWSVAMIAWDIVCPHTLIDGHNPDGIFDDRVHLAELVALLGPPPPEFRSSSKLSSVFWDESGNWKGLAPIPDIALEGLATKIKGGDTEGFLRWLRAALQWNPKDRPTAIELLYDDWLLEGLPLGKTEKTEK
ncbi:hypothetical protein LOZ61_003505 [Ophidiomyces ophidiicola]|uniref:Uncharacterized protein n=1 Tax=Ophidiomyces ophidiicola TaxID=1387563 RepID=A0ACB8UUY4_9EURO|nr:hypothetical protein LOZ61_003505 [Ophidiomyces ophidiicola]KAI1929130.1 hypothetical protein LOZ60_001780 [Ophidiomyces ophidiicola]KAI1963553.1 hypothetical protein LOZ59_001752 [Ophidiomyces ophidiicola]KAI1970733.1 hypothetical protein LOZ56_003483 [Ophidiomyces ophidiicola]KAI2021015.1 hypothetical protein LOZ48_006482 [Ophidiomyces ophidiicola]